MGIEESQTEQNKAVIRRFVEEVQNQKNWDVYDDRLSAGAAHTGSSVSNA